MSEAKPQDGSTIKGYRTLTPADIERMNRLKDASRHFLNLIDTEREVLHFAQVPPGDRVAQEHFEAMRALSIARTKMQEACMWACRAVAKPDSDC